MYTYVFDGTQFVDPTTHEPMPDEVVTYWNGQDWVKDTMTNWWKTYGSPLWLK